MIDSTTEYEIILTNFSILGKEEIVCKGVFKRPTTEDVKLLSKTPFRIFHPTTGIGYKTAFCSLQSIFEAIKECKDKTKQVEADLHN